jgi:hypothetical protein
LGAPRDDAEEEKLNIKDIQKTNLSTGVNMYTLYVTSIWYCFRCSHLTTFVRADIVAMLYLRVVPPTRVLSSVAEVPFLSKSGLAIVFIPSGPLPMIPNPWLGCRIVRTLR